MLDAIVVTQSELTAAINSGALHILLCGNNFNLPDNITYTAVGKDTALISLEECHNPQSPDSKLPPSSYKSSYRLSSYSTSYRLSSYSTSYRLSGYRTSFQYISSFLTSYRYSYEYKIRTSHFGSYNSSFRLSGIYKTSFKSSFKPASFLNKFRRKVYDRILREISVNGYGIHLI